MGKQWKTVRDFILRGSKITADGDCSHEIKILAAWKKSCDQPRQHIKKQRHYFANQGPSNQSHGFSSSHVWMWEWEHKESWVPKNWCFCTVVLEKTLESLLDCKIQPVHPKGNQSWIFIEELMLKLKLQYFGHLMRRTDSLEKTLMLGKIEDRRRRGWQRKRWLDGITDWMDMSLSKPGSRWWTRKPGGLQRVEHDWATKLNWMESEQQLENEKETEKKYTAKCIIYTKFSLNDISNIKSFNSTTINWKKEKTQIIHTQSLSALPPKGFLLKRKTVVEIFQSRVKCAASLIYWLFKIVCS